MDTHTANPLPGDQVEPQLHGARDSKQYLADVLVALASDLRDRGDLYEFQRRCEAIAHAFSGDAVAQAILEWALTEAELIDCKLIRGSVESLVSDLNSQALRLRSSDVSH